jgi:hypothetical protein
VAQPDLELLIMRTVAIMLVRIALQCDALAAEMYLIAHMAERPQDEWRARFWSPAFEARPGGVLWPRSLFEEFAKTLKTRFWPEARSGLDGAHIELNGSLAAYLGPLRLTPKWIKVRTQKGIIIPPDAFIRSAVNWQAEVHMYAIRLPLSPLVEALRRDDGYVDMALAQLQKQGLLPPSISPSRPRTEALAVTEATEARVDDEPRRDERRSRKRTRYAGAKSVRALTVLKRIYKDQPFPIRAEVSDADLGDLFNQEWAKVEGAKRGLSYRPSLSTVLRVVGRKT